MKGRYVWHALRRWWWLPALAALLAATTGYGISSRLPRVYEGRARLQVTPAQVSSRSTDYSTVLGAEGLTRVLQRNGARIDTDDAVRIFNATAINLNLHSSTYHDGVDPRAPRPKLW